MARLFWQSFPGLIGCALFWGAAFLNAYTSYRRAYNWGFLISACGIFSNALVTFANGGHMPVVGASCLPEFAIWITATSSTVLPMLGDDAHTLYCSVGDFIIIGGLIIASIVYVYRKHWRA